MVDSTAALLSEALRETRTTMRNSASRQNLCRGERARSWLAALVYIAFQISPLAVRLLIRHVSKRTRQAYRWR